MANWIEALGMTLIHFLWEGAILLIVAWIALYALRKRSSPVRYWVCCGLLVAMVAAPIATLTVLAPEPVSAVGEFVADSKAPPMSSISLPKTLPLEAQDSQVLRFVVIGWLVGVGALCLRLVGGFAALARLRYTGIEDAPEALRSRFLEIAKQMGVWIEPRLYVSSRVLVPTAIGLFRGIVLLPASVIAGTSPQQLESLLAHELAHIARFDFLVNAVQSFVEIALFYHPAVWWLSNRIREERENCCDDRVVAVFHDRRTYARALARMEELRVTALTLRADGGELLVRIRRILGENQVKTILSPVSTACLLGALVIVPVLYSQAAAIPPTFPSSPQSPVVKPKVVKKAPKPSANAKPKASNRIPPATPRSLADPVAPGSPSLSVPREGPRIPPATTDSVPRVNVPSAPASGRTAPIPMPSSSGELKPGSLSDPGRIPPPPSEMGAPFYQTDANPSPGSPAPGGPSSKPSLRANMTANDYLIEEIRGDIEGALEMRRGLVISRNRLKMSIVDHKISPEPDSEKYIADWNRGIGILDKQIEELSDTLAFLRQNLKTAQAQKDK